MKSIIAIVLAAACAMSAQASESAAQERSALLPSTIGLHMGSRHDDNGPQVAGSLGWNNRNLGVYGVWHLHQNSYGQHGVGLGYIHRNSLFKPSVYVAYNWNSTALHTRLGAFSLGANVGVFLKGYDKAVNPGVNHTGAVPSGHDVSVRCTAATGCVNQLLKPAVVPMLAASLAWQPSANWPALRLSRLPKSGSTGSAAWHLSAEYSF